MLASLSLTTIRRHVWHQRRAVSRWREDVHRPGDRVVFLFLFLILILLRSPFCRPVPGVQPRGASHRRHAFIMSRGCAMSQALIV
jgi:hypothetical protein